ncbi:hypothetical protein RB195_006725 [Necator americanus]|uniref:C2H2-type domain-containing protein n=1 Tax=Necator americanus TaxID=51031 RepID=A0ABR1BX89_NECAM
MFSLQEILSSPMLSALAQPSISTPPQNFGVPFNAQLYMFMNAHLQNMFTSLQRNNKVKEEVEENEEHTHRPLDSEHAKQCPHCDRVYVSMPALSMHILTHKANHKCEICGKVFSRLWLLQGHLRSHTGQRPFGCAHCGKSFADRSNLRAHILTHTGEKKYSCKSCGRRFALRSYLNRHMETSCKSENN